MPKILEQPDRRLVPETIWYFEIPPGERIVTIHKLPASFQVIDVGWSRGSVRVTYRTAKNEPGGLAHSYVLVRDYGSVPVSAAHLGSSAANSDGHIFHLFEVEQDVAEQLRSKA